MFTILALLGSSRKRRRPRAADQATRGGVALGISRASRRLRFETSWPTFGLFDLLMLLRPQWPCVATPSLWGLPTVPGSEARASICT